MHAPAPTTTQEAQRRNKTGFLNADSHIPPSLVGIDCTTPHAEVQSRLLISALRHERDIGHTNPNFLADNLLTKDPERFAELFFSMQDPVQSAAESGLVGYTQPGFNPSHYGGLDPNTRDRAYGRTIADFHLDKDGRERDFWGDYFTQRRPAFAF